MLNRRSAVFLTVLLWFPLPVWAQPATTPVTPAPAAESARAAEETWYAIEAAHQPSGYRHDSRTTSAGTITSNSEMVFAVKRDGQSVHISVRSTFVETTDFKPVSMTSTVQLGAKPVITEYRFTPDKVTVTTTQGDQSSTQTVANPPGWLTPAGADQFVLKRQAAEAATIKIRVLDPLSGLDPVDITYTLAEKGTLPTGEKSVKAWKYATSVSKLPGIKTLTWFDERGELLREETDLMGAPMVTSVSTKDKALANTGGAEILVTSYIKPDRRIPAARSTAIGSFVLKARKGEIPELPNEGPQKVERLAPDSVRITVATADRPTVTDAEAADPKLLGSSTMINAKDPLIVDLAAQATKAGGGTSAKEAEACRAFVYRYISNKNFGVAFGTASETARSKSGDCTEHGVLLAALLRARGIPARIVSGLVYVDDGRQAIFGYHMWAQALLANESGVKSWVDLDGTLSPTLPFDATHLALAVTPLADGELESSMAALVTLIGNLDIVVESAK